MLKMKSLRGSLLDDDLITKTDKMIKDEIKSFLKENYDGLIKISKKHNAAGKYEVSSTKNIRVKNYNMTSLTNGMFIWDKVTGNFDCSVCLSLESLKGAPKEVGEDFSCIDCPSLESLEGAPKEIGGNFICHICRSLTSLKGGPKKIGGNFNCMQCRSLASLEGAPEKVGGYFECRFCKVKFTEDDIKKISNVKGEIEC